MGGQVGIMGRHEDGLALGDQVVKDGKDGLCRAGVEAAGGFVGGDQDRVIGERAGDGDPLALAAGDFRGTFVGVLGDADGVQQRPAPVCSGPGTRQSGGQNPSAA